MKKPEISTRQRIEAVREYRLESILSEDQAEKAAAENAYMREYQRQRQFDPEVVDNSADVDSDSNNYDPAMMAAVMNEKYGYSTICADSHWENRVVIVEKMRQRNLNSDEHFKPFRIKVTQYYFSNNMEGVRKWAKDHKIKLKEYGDHNGSENV